MKEKKENKEGNKEGRRALTLILQGYIYYLFLFDILFYYSIYDIFMLHTLSPYHVC